MKSFLKGILASILYALLSVSLIACGSGGGGGGGSSSSDSGRGSGSGGGGISYSGSTNQATVTNANALEISTSAYQGGSTGTTLGTMGVVQTDNSQVGSSRSVILSQTLKHALLQVDVTATSGVAISSAVVTETGSIPGDCPLNPGSASYTESYDDVTGNFSGAMNFNSYCSEGVTISGSANYSGQVNVVTEEILQFIISFSSLTATSGNESFTADGNISFNFSVSPMTTTLSLLLRDNSTSQVSKIENFSMTLTDGVDYVDVNIVSGRFYHPDYGYVEVSTPTPLRIYYGYDWPSQGDLVCTGNTGIGGGSTKVKLTALSSIQYKVEADSNGDGIYSNKGDYDSGPLNWSDF